MRRKARKDDNHNEIMEAFLKLGASAHDTSRLGNDFPDLVIGMYGLTVLVEVKDGSKPPSARKLTDGQFAFFRDFKGWTAVIKSADEVPNLLRIMKQEADYRLAGWKGKSWTTNTAPAVELIARPRGAS